MEALQAYGFSPAMQERFFRPFLSGVFLDQSLSSPCRLFEFVWAAFSRGAIALAQLAGTQVVLASGERLSAEALVLATDYATAATLRGETLPTAPGRPATSLYFEAPAPPVRGPWLIVNGEQEGPVGTACVLSEVAPSYAPKGRAVISVSLSDQTTPGNVDQQQAVRKQLRDWFGAEVDAWRHLRTDHISRALPPFAQLSARNGETSPRLRAGLYQCGDYCETGTLDGALLSGRKAADAILADLRVL
jgi:hypothetical protein